MKVYLSIMDRTMRDQYDINCPPFPPTSVFDYIIKSGGKSYHASRLPEAVRVEDLRRDSGPGKSIEILNAPQLNGYRGKWIWMTEVKEVTP